MSFGLVLLHEPHRKTVVDFLNPHGIRTRPLETAREIRLDEDMVWHLSRTWPRLFVDGDIRRERTIWVLDVENPDEATQKFGDLLSHPFPNITIDVVEAGGYCRMRDQTTGQPQKRVALLADLVFCPLSWAEQRCFRRFLDQCELQAAA